ncbi:hypothetical protein ABZM97_15945 [Bacillus vallismortis]|uniref:hypothetical protein n=1 Tax=Bacillus TaxID=1386 RepID=UPI0019283788|nr:hypothetical protein [Bacillus sp. RHFS10]MBL3648420.1 hypothetical protein [Bacillus sp. RHFS10]
MALTNDFIIYLYIKGNAFVDRYHITVNGEEKTRMFPAKISQTCHEDDTFDKCYCRRDYVEIFKVPPHHVAFNYAVTATDPLGGLHKTNAIPIDPSHYSKRAFIKVNIVPIDDGNFTLKESD